MRLLVTGAGGFVGRAILADLGGGFECYATSRFADRKSDDRVQWRACDLLEDGAAQALIDTVRPEVVIHAAWYTGAGGDREDREHAAWLLASGRLLDAFVAAGGRRFVSVGSCAEYLPGDAPCHESRTPHAGGSSYGRAKAAFRQRLDQVGRANGVETCHARLFFLYGRGEKPTRLVPALIHRLQAGKPAETGPGDRVRDYMSVDDAGRALARLAGSRLTGPINIASGEPATIAQIATRLGDLAGRPDLLRIGALPGRADEARAIVADVGRQTTELGFRPEIPLRRGLEEAFLWWISTPERRRIRAPHIETTRDVHSRFD